eukprot:6096349-Pleurochrysis_carterae.AAC.2
MGKDRAASVVKSGCVPTNPLVHHVGCRMLGVESSPACKQNSRCKIFAYAAAALQKTIVAPSPSALRCVLQVGSNHRPRVEHIWTVKSVPPEEDECFGRFVGALRYHTVRCTVAVRGGGDAAMRARAAMLSCSSKKSGSLVEKYLILCV